MKQIILFLLTYIFVFIIYKVMLIGKNKKRNSKKKPMEVKYLETKYNLDLKKLNYKNLLRIIALVSSLDISLIVTIAFLFESYLLELLIILVLRIPTIIISYSFVGNYYVKKGMIKDE